MSHKITRMVLVSVLMELLVACGTGTTTTIGPNPTQPLVAADTSTPGAMVIANSTAFVDKYGTYRVVGMLVNNSSYVLTSIELTIEIKDASGNSLLKENGNPVLKATFHPMLYTLAPGEGSPFEYSYDTGNGIPASYKVIISNIQSGDVSRADLTAENVQLVDNGSGWYYLTGDLVNKGTQWTRINNLAGAVLDASNNVLSADWTATYATELAPTGDPSGGDRTPFEINFPNPGTSGTPPWSLYWDAEIMENVTSYAITTTITNGYIDQYGAQHVVGWVINHSDQALSSSVVAGLYDQAGTTLDASFSNIPIPIRAGGSVPFSVTTFGNVDNNQTQAALVRTYAAEVDPGNTTPTKFKFIELPSSSETIHEDGATWNISGNATNTSDQELSTATVVVSIIDSQNALVATEYTTIFPSGDTIAVGEEDPYTVSISLDPSIDSSGFKINTMVIGVLNQ